MRGIFVTGTDTGIGKTYVSSLLVKHFRQTENVCYWKPIQTGIEADNDTQDVCRAAECSPAEIFDQGFRLEKPLSPHLSARLANVEITVENVLNFLKNADLERFFIVEGAGGILVPLNERELMIDLIKALKLPAVVAARSGLGTINHTLLTLDALRRRDVEIKGVIFSGEPNAENIKAVEHFGNVKVFAEAAPDAKFLNFR